MSFPIITHLSQFDEILKTKSEIKLKEETVLGQKVYIIAYMVSMPNTFDSALAKECRGITFDADGNVISRPFHKFMNVGQTEDSQPDKIDWNNVSLITEKIDGSLMTPVHFRDNGQSIIKWKSKKSFYSDVAIATEKLPMPADVVKYLGVGETPMYEFVSPDHRIVLDYQTDQLHYLMSRNMRTGEYNIDSRISDPRIIKTISRDRIADIYQFIDTVKGMEGIEGYVIWDGHDFYKIKTQWYLERHRAMDAISIRDLIDLIVEDKIDDIIATLNLYGLTRNIDLINKYCEEMAHATRVWDTYVNSTFIYCRNEFDGNRKAIAEYLFKHHKQIATLVFNKLDNKEYYTPMRKIIGTHIKDKYKGRVLFMGQEKNI